MTLKEKIKRFALKHEKLLAAYRSTFGKIKTKYYFNAQRKALQKNGLKLIGKIDKAVSEAGGVCFVDFGTLLGLVRDGSLIKHDMDIDFGIYLTDDFTKDNLDEVMHAIGLKKYRSFYYKDEPVEISYSSGIINIDFFKHFENEEYSTVYYFHRDADRDYPDNDSFDVYKRFGKHISGIKKVDTSGISFNIPENAEEYLESQYGKTWRTPNSGWKTSDCKSLWRLDGEYGILK